MDMDIQNNGFLSIDQLANQYLNSSRKTVKAAQENLVSFQEILQSKSNEQLKFSKHASMRLENRKINLSKEQSERLESGVQKASEKGIRESLVIVDSLAFIVNVPNKTVVTAMDRTESDDNIYTNIDGAVII